LDFQLVQYDPNGIVERWSGAARRGTLANIAWSLAFLALIALLMQAFS